VEFGVVAGRSLRVLSPTKLLVTAPKHAAGLVDVEVVTGTGRSRPVTADKFSYVPPPQVSSVSPAVGTRDGGTPVTIYGAHFTGATRVLFGAAAAARFSIVDASEIMAPAPRGSGTVNIRVVTRYGTSGVAAADQFSYLYYSSLTWGPLTRIAGNGGGSLTAISCPAATDCRAFDWSGREVTWNGTDWTAPASVLGAAIGPVWRVDGLSCPSVSFCAAVGNDHAFIYSGGTWQEGTTPFGFHNWGPVSCPTSSFCVTLDDAGDYMLYKNGAWTSPATLWTATGGVRNRGVSCVSATFCVAVNNAGDISLWNGTTWTTARVAQQTGMQSVSCVSVTFCMAVTAAGQAFTFSGSTWSGPVADGLSGAEFISCTSDTFCGAGGSNGATALFTGSGWSPPQQAFPAGQTVTGMACADQTCAVVGGGFQGQANTYAAGEANTLVSGTWTGALRVDVAGGINSLSCPATSFCAAVTVGGDVVTGHPGGWQAPVHLADAALTAVSCTSATFCLASAGDGQQWTYDGAHWTSTLAATSDRLRTEGLSCVSPTFCVASGDLGLSVFNGATWSTPAAAGPVWDSVSCATTTFCAASSLSNNGYGFSTIFDGKSWSAPAGSDSFVWGLSCPVAGFCAAGNSMAAGGFVFTGGSWRPVPVPESNPLYQVSCTARTFCAGLGLIYGYSFNGTQWSQPTPTGFSHDLTFGSDQPTAISCVTSTFCVAANALGYVTVAT
jgi:hypothetical protein